MEFNPKKWLTLLAATATLNASAGDKLKQSGEDVAPAKKIENRDQKSDNTHSSQVATASFEDALQEKQDLSGVIKNIKLKLAGLLVEAPIGKHNKKLTAEQAYDLVENLLAKIKEKVPSEIGKGRDLLSQESITALISVLESEDPEIRKISDYLLFLSQEQLGSTMQTTTGGTWAGESADVTAHKFVGNIMHLLTYRTVQQALTEDHMIKTDPATASK